jgi:hypothetical protein
MFTGRKIHDGEPTDRHGLVLIASIRRKLQTGSDATAAMIDGSLERVRPGSDNRTRRFARYRADGARDPRRG